MTRLISQREKNKMPLREVHKFAKGGIYLPPFAKLLTFLLFSGVAINEPRSEKTGLRGFRPGLKKTGCTAIADG